MEGSDYPEVRLGFTGRKMPAYRSIKPLNLPDVARGKLRQHVAVSRVDFSHWRCAFFADVNI
jgi:hypothetical protein